MRGMLERLLSLGLMLLYIGFMAVSLPTMLLTSLIDRMRRDSPGLLVLALLLWPITLLVCGARWLARWLARRRMGRAVPADDRIPRATAHHRRSP